MDTATVQNSLMAWLRHKAALTIIQNTYLGIGEHDLIVIRPSLYWIEYEVKTSRSDYFRDLRKSPLKIIGTPTKHELYSSDGPCEVVRRSGRTQRWPQPKGFNFVVPAGLVDIDEVPNHAGLVQVDGRAVEVIKKAPVLPCSTKLTDKELYSICNKLSRRI